VLVDGDTVLYEASAINIYHAEKSGSGLLPKLGRERYEVLQWMFRSGEQWRINSSTLFAERIGKRVMGQPENLPVTEHMMATLRAACAVLDQHHIWPPANSSWANV
jgi:glutathione S-transferase